MTVEYAPGGGGIDSAVMAEFNKIAQSLASLAAYLLPTVYEEPDKPRVGMMRYADGSSWDPGDGEGVYLYTSTGWSFMGGPAGGAGGADGLSVYQATVYKRSASSPSTPTVDDGSYNFGTEVLTPPSGWSTTPPAADGNPLWVSHGVFSIQGTTGVDSTVTWSAPAQFAIDGVDGADGADGSAGLSTFYALVFKRSASAPSTPAADDGSYDFDTGTLTPPSGWSTSPPTADGNPLWVSDGLFEIAGDTGTDNTVTWTAPHQLLSDGVDGADGADGTDGTAVFYASVFKRSASAPSTPTADDGSYNFATRTLTPPSGWSDTPPATDGNPLWVSNGIFEGCSECFSQQSS